MSKLRHFQRASIAALGTVLIGACTPRTGPEDFARSTQGYVVDVDKIFVVDCLLPGQVRKLGSRLTYLSARRPIRTSAADCEVRGGEYVAYDRANYNSALQVWLPKAEEGDPAAQLYVGQIYEKGLGRAPDYKSAAAWYKKAADQGNAQAQINLGHLYEQGRGVPKDRQTAATWYGRASGLTGSGLQFASATAAPATTGAAEPLEMQALRENARRQSAEAASLRSQLNDARQQLLQQQESLRHAREDLEAARRRLDEQRSAPRRQDAGIRPREDEVWRKESELREQQARLEAAERSVAEAERLRKELHDSEQRLAQQQKALDATRGDLEEARRRTASVQVPSPDDTRMRQLQRELDRKESLLREQQAKLDQTSAELADEKARMGRTGEEADRQRTEAEQLRTQLKKTQAELETARTKATAGKAGPPADDAALRQLETDLREKEMRLRAEQAKLDASTAEVTREQQRAARQTAKPKLPGAGGKPPVSDPLTQARAELDASEQALARRMAAYQKESSELTELLTRPASADDEQTRSEIETRKKQLATEAAAIADLRRKVEDQGAKVSELEQQGGTVAQGGPEIVIIDPEPRSTRGIPSIHIEADTPAIIGKVKAPSGLQSLLANDKPLSTDAAGMFRIALGGESSGDVVNIVATDKRSRRTDLRVALIRPVSWPTATTTGAQSSKGRGYFRDVDFGGFFALIIGNNTYAAYPALKTAVDDAKSMDVILRERYGFKTKLLLNANRHDILTAINDVKAKLTERDNLLVYFAGHGEIDPRGENGYWLPTDAEVGNPANWISSESITDLLSIMAARHILVVADSCYSGALSASAVAALPAQIDEARRAKWVQAVNARKARTVLTSGGVEPVLDQGSSGHSVFTNAVLKVLRQNDGVLEDYALFGRIFEPVQAASSRLGLTQSPQYAALQHAGHEGSPFFFVPQDGG